VVLLGPRLRNEHFGCYEDVGYDDVGYEDVGMLTPLPITCARRQIWREVATEVGPDALGHLHL